jgi:hypothetical protein
MKYGNIYCETFTENKLFDYASPRNSDGLFTPYIMLREKLLALGIEVNTPDLNASKDVAFEVHMDGRPLLDNKIDKYLIAVENPHINKFNADVEHLKQFRRVFSWNELTRDLKDGVQILNPNNITVADFRSYADRAIFSCLISSNKLAPWFGPNDLYSERINVIRWHEKNAPSLFELYGRGWGKPSTAFSRKDKLLRRINRLRTQLFGYKPFPSWRGEVNFKSEILANAKFSYCYENIKNLPNYITEKIFDSFMYGCVPIYWGADNVQEYIPSNCFVDRRRFKDTAEVHRYLMNMTPEEYDQFQINIAAFLKSDKAHLFSAEHFSTTIANTIAGDLVQRAG